MAKINVKAKGNRYERRIAKLLRSSLGVTAYKTDGSGSYTSRKDLGYKIKDLAAGDVCIEEIPQLYIECKNYSCFYLSNWISYKIKTCGHCVQNFWSKAVKEAVSLQKIPIIICKESNSPDAVIMNYGMFRVFESYIGKIHRTIVFICNKDDLNKNLVMFQFSEILKLDFQQLKTIISYIKDNVKIT